MLATPASLPLGVGPFESNDPLGKGSRAHSAASRPLLGMAEQQQGGRNPKRPRVEADKRRDALLHVQDEYADIDFTKYQKLVGAGAACVATDGSVGGGDGSDGGGGATPPRFATVRPVATALVRDWRQLSSYEPVGESMSEAGFRRMLAAGSRRHGQAGTG